MLRNLIFRNDFTYTKSGILDRGHIRLFTIKSAEIMMRESGFTIVKMVPLYGKTKNTMLSKVLPMRFFCNQFIVVGEKK